ncbi:2Fe-2S iron-sulfur cluster-binding protein [Streptomyces sp. NPDC059861]|uniref:2Fe-2S iron-sulfur cluster-binding protein n=1 Tax=Streptomyces sp. NPDC059861 TaxID=3346974 RepID=UPI00365AA437
MTDDQHGEGTPQGGGRWDPLPQGDYDDGATAFVKLPEGGIDALLAAADSPLAAPGHGYVPPPITVTPATGTDPAATGTWGVPSEGAQWPDPNASPQGGGQDRFTYDPGTTGQWNFEGTGHPEAGHPHAGHPQAAPAPGHDVTGQWSIPVANGDLPDESGEFTTSALVEQWGGTPPTTLPGGASAPWATETGGQPWGHEDAFGHDGGQRHDGGPRHEDGPGHEGGPGHAGGLYADAPAQHPTGGVPAGGEGPDGAHEAAGALEGVEAAERAAEAPGGMPGAPKGLEAAEGPSEGSGESVAGRAAGSPSATGASAPAGDADAGPEHAALEGEPDASAEPSGAASHEDHPLASYVLRVNGADRPVTDAWIGESLLYVLRERLGLAGAKDGCSQGECGACNVQVDGRLVASCLVPAVTAAGSEVRTVEGLAVDGRPSDVQRALAKCGAVQCGFCVPGMAMTVHDLLEGNPAPTELETRQALCGNLCRCSGYRAVLEAVKDVVAERDAHSAADAPGPDADEPRIPHQAGPGAGGVNRSAFESPGGPHGTRDQSYGQGQDGGQA